MTFFGISTRRPTFGEITAASVMALGLWLALCAVLLRLDQSLSRFDAGALLLVIEWGCVAVRMGIRPDRGMRHLAANFTVGALLLGVYSQAWAAFA
jgi:hypothetical protein